MKISPKTKKYLLYGGGALALYLIYRWWRGQPGSTSGNFFVPQTKFEPLPASASQGLVLPPIGRTRQAAM